VGPRRERSSRGAGRGVRRPKKQSRESAREKRLNTAPTWSNSLKRAALAAVFIFAFMLLTTKGSNRIQYAVVFALFALALYVPAGYYLELFLFRRRQRKKQATR
jgi:hypothetical protein